MENGELFDMFGGQPVTIGVCKDWRAGRCSRNPCMFMHRESPPLPNMQEIGGQLLKNQRLGGNSFTENQVLGRNYLHMHKFSPPPQNKMMGIGAAGKLVRGGQPSMNHVHNAMLMHTQNKMMEIIAARKLVPGGHPSINHVRNAMLMHKYSPPPQNKVETSAARKFVLAGQPSKNKVCTDTPPQNKVETGAAMNFNLGGEPLGHQVRKRKFVFSEQTSKNQVRKMSFEFPTVDAVKIEVTNTSFKVEVTVPETCIVNMDCNGNVKMTKQPIVEDGGRASELVKTTKQPVVVDGGGASELVKTTKQTVVVDGGGASELVKMTERLKVEDGGGASEQTKTTEEPVVEDGGGASELVKMTERLKVEDGAESSEEWLMVGDGASSK